MKTYRTLLGELIIKETSRIGLWSEAINLKYINKDHVNSLKKRFSADCRDNNDD